MHSLVATAAGTARARSSPRGPSAGHQRGDVGARVLRPTSSPEARARSACHTVRVRVAVSGPPSATSRSSSRSVAVRAAPARAAPRRSRRRPAGSGGPAAARAGAASDVSALVLAAHALDVDVAGGERQRPPPRPVRCLPACPERPSSRRPVRVIATSSPTATSAPPSSAVIAAQVSSDARSASRRQAPPSSATRDAAVADGHAGRRARQHDGAQGRRDARRDRLLASSPCRRRTGSSPARRPPSRAVASARKTPCRSPVPGGAVCDRPVLAAVLRDEDRAVVADGDAERRRRSGRRAASPRRRRPAPGAPTPSRPRPARSLLAPTAHAAFCVGVDAVQVGGDVSGAGGLGLPCRCPSSRRIAAASPTAQPVSLVPTCDGVRAARRAAATASIVHALRAALRPQDGAVLADRPRVARRRRRRAAWRRRRSRTRRRRAARRRVRSRRVSSARSR